MRVGYQTAATLGPWTLTRTRSGPIPEYEADASLSSCDAFWSQQGPMDLELTMGQRIWAWAQVQPSLTAESLTVTLLGGPSIH
ncbi:MAG TPA: hypothetical protein DCP69_04830 [Candidatus Omnitrophica bacterium]|nr:hypothetical protein [Candidatus Omnitrophota bacterium]